MLTWRSKWYSTVIFVADKVWTPLLGRYTIEALDLIHRVEAISTIPVDICTQYPNLFTGLSCMSEPYEIRIKHDATPYAITSPRRVPLPLLPKVKDELERLQHFNFTEKVNTPTEWCAPMVVVQKKDRRYQIIRRRNKTKWHNMERETDTTGSRSNASHIIRHGRLLEARLQQWVFSNHFDI